MGRASASPDVTVDVDTTIGQPAERLIYDWAEAADVAGPLALLAAALRMRTATQALLFRGILDAIDPIAPILRTWEINGSQTYGAAKLAAAWRRRPQHLDAMVPRRADVGTSSDADFELDIREGLLSTRHDALFFLLGRPYPHGPEDGVHRRLRAWALMHGLRLFALSPKPDKLLYRVSRTLAHAALETEGRTWRGLLERIGAHADRREQIDQRLIALVDTKGANKLPVHRDFLSAAYQLAISGSDPYDDKWAAPLSQEKAADWLQSIQNRAPISELGSEALEPLAPTLLPTEQPPDDSADDGHDICCFESDPEQTTDEQAQAVQIVRFRLGAAARFLPWDWLQLIPPERDALRALVAHGLANPTHAAEQSLAAIMSVALAAGLSIAEVAALPLDSALGDAVDWWLHLDSGSLVRNPPRHAAHWKPTSKAAALVRPAARELRFPLSTAIVAPLRTAKMRRPKAVMLGQLWFDQGTSLEAAFRSWVRQDPRTSRIQSSMVAKLLGQTTFERSNDSVLARLIMSNRVAPLPSSTVYTAYGLDQLATATPGVEANPLQPDNLPPNAAGSLLESIDNDLVDSSFAELLDAIEQYKGRKEVVRFHNAIALYWDAVLRAATGARPVSGLWPSPAHFDWDNSAVYIDDKASPAAHTGRMVPLPLELCAEFKASYVERHLPWILGQLEAVDAIGSTPLPALLFFLEDDTGPPDPVVIENKHRKLKDRNQIEGRLPLNLFRHRLRTLLHREPEVDLEVVDTVLGHGDGATLTHGNFSMRIWCQDAEAIRPALTRIFNSLHIKLPPVWTNTLPAEKVSHVTQDKGVTWTAGRLIDRSTDQERKAASQRELADSIIRQFLANSRPTEATLANEDVEPPPQTSESLPAIVASLSEDQLDVLSRRLLSDEHGMPSATGPLRYARLLQLAGMAFDQLGLRARFRKRYSARELESSPFTPLAAQTSALVRAMRQGLDLMFEAARERSRIKLKHALALAIPDLVLTSRITNQVLLRSVIEDDRYWRIVRFEDEFFLEWSPSDDLTRKPTAPTQRFVISLRCAWLLNHVVRGKTRRATSWESSHAHAHPLSSACAQAFGADQGADSSELLTNIVATMDQANVCELPGSVAGFLAGRVWTASLGWGDWLRLRSGRWVNATPSAQPGAAMGKEVVPAKWLRLDQLPDDSDDEFEIVSETQFQDADEIAQSRASPTTSRSDAAYKLVASVRRRLHKLTGAEDGSKHRAKAAELMSREIHESAASVSSSIQLLCLWSIDMLLRPGRSRKLATSSVITYFSRLSPRFLSMGYGVDLAAMEDFEIEAFYSSVLSAVAGENLKQTYDGLWNFHKFSQMACGLPDIDWSALAVSDRIKLGSPGFIDEASYLVLLNRLSDERELSYGANWQLQCVALFAFRFGLRGGEAAGLRRSDLRLDGPQPYLIVRNNRERDLKTRASRRVVPLLFKLTPVELAALRRLGDFHAIDGVDLKDAPAFTRVDDPRRPVDGFKMRAVINRHLKAVTGQASSSMHKLRKAFVIRVWRAIEAPTYAAVGLPRESETDRQRIRLTVLGSGRDQTSRRGAWAVAQMCGHSHIQSTLRSYAHILSDVAQKSVAIAPLPASLGLRPDLVKVPALDTLFAEISPTAHGSAALAPSTTPVDSLRALLFLSRGRSPSEAAEFSNIPIPRIEQLSAITERICKKLLDSDPTHLQKHLDNPKSRRLARRGILSLLHVNAHARLRAGLTTLPANLLQRISSIQTIDAPEWDAMVGGRREISMWQPNHFELTAVAARHFLETRSRAKLLAPRSMTATDSVRRLTDMAIVAGWLPPGHTGPRDDDGATPICSGIEAGDRLPRVRREDKGFTVDDRLVLRLTGIDSNDHVCDGLELAVVLACLNAFTSTASG